MKTLNLILVVLLVLLQFRLWSGNGSLPDVWHLQDRRARQQAENGELRERNRSLAAEVMDLKQGLVAVEERARSEMGMIMPGETFFQIIDLPASPPSGDRENR